MSQEKHVARGIVAGLTAGHSDSPPRTFTHRTSCSRPDCTARSPPCLWGHHRICTTSRSATSLRIKSDRSKPVRDHLIVPRLVTWHRFPSDIQSLDTYASS